MMHSVTLQLMKVRRFVRIALCVSFVIACNKSDEPTTSTTGATTPRTSSSGSSFNLINTKFLEDQAGKVSNVADGSYEDTATRSMGSGSACDIAGGEGIPQAYGELFEVPARVLTLVDEMMMEIVTKSNFLFGEKTGVFSRLYCEDFGIRVNSGTALTWRYRNENGQTSFARVRDVGKERGLPKLRMELWEPADSGFKNTYHIEWVRYGNGHQCGTKKNANKPEDAKVKFVSLTGSPARHFYADYDTYAGQMLMVYGYESPDSGTPRMTALYSREAVRKDDQNLTSYVSAAAAYEWYIEDADEPSADSVSPRHYARSNGDVELAQIVYRRSSNPYGVQAMGYIPAKNVPLYQDVPGLALETNSISKHHDEWVSTLLRHPQVTSSCATLGSTLRDAFDAVSTVRPRSLADLPQDLCLKSGGVSHADVIHALRDMCIFRNNGSVVSLLMPLVLNGSPEICNVCSMLGDRATYVGDDLKFYNVIGNFAHFSGLNTGNSKRTFLTRDQWDTNFYENELPKDLKTDQLPNLRVLNRNNWQLQLRSEVMSESDFGSTLTP